MDLLPFGFCWHWNGIIVLRVMDKKSAKNSSPQRLMTPSQDILERRSICWISQPRQMRQHPTGHILRSDRPQDLDMHPPSPHCSNHGSHENPILQSDMPNPTTSNNQRKGWDFPEGHWNNLILPDYIREKQVWKLEFEIRSRAGWSAPHHSYFC